MTQHRPKLKHTFNSTLLHNNSVRAYKSGGVGSYFISHHALLYTRYFLLKCVLSSRALSCFVSRATYSNNMRMPRAESHDVDSYNVDVCSLSLSLLRRIIEFKSWLSLRRGHYSGASSFSSPRQRVLIARSVAYMSRFALVPAGFSYHFLAPQAGYIWKDGTIETTMGSLPRIRRAYVGQRAEWLQKSRVRCGGRESRRRFTT